MDFDGLVAAASGDDRLAWDELVRRLSGVVWARLRRYHVAPSVRDDAFQLAFLRLAEHLDSIRRPECLPGWIAVTAANEMNRLLKGRSRTVPTAECGEQEPDAAAPPDRELLASEVKSVVRAAMRGLSERDAAIVSMRYLDAEGVGYAEIGQRLGMRHGSIGPTLGRSLEKMGEHPSVRRLR